MSSQNLWDSQKTEHMHTYTYVYMYINTHARAHTHMGAYVRVWVRMADRQTDLNDIYSRVISTIQQVL